jgi:hypothetical protein
MKRRRASVWRGPRLPRSPPAHNAANPSRPVPGNMRRGEENTLGAAEGKCDLNDGFRLQTLIIRRRPGRQAAEAG